MGGLTGQWLAFNKPERFSHVIVCNTATKNWSGTGLE